MWKVGKYDCCEGSMECANNRTQRLVDTVFAEYEKDKVTARNMLFEVIADREEQAEYLQYKLAEFMKERRIHDPQAK